MKQEDKELLLRDLCARLPYKVIVDYGHNAFNVHKGYYVERGSKCILTCYLLNVFISPRQNEKGEYIKPYLRPLSSMSEEQNKELHDKLIELELQALNGEINRIDAVKFEIDYYLKNHIDYCGLIEKGLALEAPKEMYN